MTVPMTTTPILRSTNQYPTASDGATALVLKSVPIQYVDQTMTAAANDAEVHL